MDKNEKIWQEQSSELNATGRTHENDVGALAMSSVRLVASHRDTCGHSSGTGSVEGSGAAPTTIAVSHAFAAVHKAPRMLTDDGILNKSTKVDRARALTTGQLHAV